MYYSRGRGRGRGDGGSSRGANEAATKLPSSPPSPQKQTVKGGKKKRIKWIPFDLQSAGSSSESISTTTSESLSTPSEELTEAPSEELTEGQVPLLQAPATDLALRTPEKTGGSTSPITERFPVYSDNRFVDLDPTPTQSTFNESFAHKSALTPTQDQPLVHHDDTDSTKDKLEGIMSRIDDAFDIEEWDPALPPADVDNSPEPLTIKPEPIAYTTVGSLVKSNAAPQFTAPVRIQREGASRRPPPPPLQNRGHDSYPGIRGIAPQQSMSYNAAGTTPFRPQYQPPQQPTLNSSTFTDVEKDVLQKLGVNTAPTMRSGNAGGVHNSGQRVDPFSGNAAAGASISQDLDNEDKLGQLFLSSSTMSTMDKMQTLIALARYPNRMQQFAKDRLAEFAATNIESPGPAGGLSSTQQLAISSGAQLVQPGGNSMSQSQADYENHRPGTLDHKYRFPPPGLPAPPKSESAAAGYGYQPSYQPSFLGEHIPTEKQHEMLSGRPQPLRAGPPGQRQNMTGNSQQNWGSLRGPHSTYSPAIQQSANLPPNSPWLAHNRQNMFTSVPVRGSQIRDTLSPAEAAKYYPNGLPPDMTGEYTPRDPAKVEEDRVKKLNDWFYGGVQRLNKSAEDHLCELEQREYERNSGYVPQPIAPPPMASADKLLSVDQVKAMSDPECAAPLLDGLFGTLLGYADKSVTPTNKSIMSRFEQADPRYIDSSEKGNESFFSEDRGQPSERDGHDPTN